MTDPTKTRLKWMFIALVGVGAGGVAVVAAMMSGGFDTAVTSPYPQWLTWAIHRTMIDSVKVRSRNVVPPPNFTPAEVAAGFRVYDSHCAMCHGGPGVPRQPWVAGMHPPPPYLVDANRHWSRSNLYWIIERGVKMSAMPAWGMTLSRGQIWDVVAFLEHMPDMNQADYARLRAGIGKTVPPPPTQPPPVGAAPAPGPQRPALSPAVQDQAGAAR